MGSITLMEAFSKRNELKKQIAFLSGKAKENLWYPENNPINFKIGSRVNPEEALAKSLELMDELQKLNTAINVANMGNNELLRELETVSAKISMLEDIENRYSRYVEREVNYAYSNGVVGVPQFIENKLVGNPSAISTSLGRCRSRKREIEKALLKNNVLIEVEL